MCKQQEDPTLATTRKLAKKGSQNEEDTGFFYQEGLLVLCWSPKNSTSEEATINQLMLPAAYGRMVMKLVDEIPMAGHMGKTKTSDCVLQ